MFLFNIFIHSLNKNILFDFSFYHFGGNTRGYCDEIGEKMVDFAGDLTETSLMKTVKLHHERSKSHCSRYVESFSFVLIISNIVYYSGNTA